MPNAPRVPNARRPPELIRHLNDPEHPLTLEQLKVASLEGVLVDDSGSKGGFARGTLGQRRPTPRFSVPCISTRSYFRSPSPVDIFFTPTIPHCSMATLIGLCIRVKLLRALPPRFKVRAAAAAAAARV